MTVHIRGLCLLVDGIRCSVPVDSKINKKQPHVTMQGWASEITVIERIAYIE